MLEDIVNTHYSRIYAYCLSILMNREKAEDACHDVFLKVQRNLASLDTNRNITGWLLTVARNHCYDIYRADSREFTIEFLPEVLADRSMNPEEQLLHKERVETIVDCLKKLKPAYREILVLRDISGHSYRELAAHLGLERKKVKWMLYKARKKVRMMVEDCDETE